MSTNLALVSFKWGVAVQDAPRIVPCESAISDLLDALRGDAGKLPHGQRAKLVKLMVHSLPRLLNGELMAVEIIRISRQCVQIHGMYRAHGTGGGLLQVQLSNKNFYADEQPTPRPWLLERCQRACQEVRHDL